MCISGGLQDIRLLRCAVVLVPHCDLIELDDYMCILCLLLQAEQYILSHAGQLTGMRR